ncbi:MAG: lamin tail domain-containing protein [Candidatus Woesearchaeota archaeon]|nr:lamin tail domain-containing protein [Candidatus Woesearchaeota archaeon]
MILVMIILTSFARAEMRINEIMYNPEGDDNNKEFIEIYMDTPLNLSGWIVSDSSSNDTLKTLQYTDYSNYALIVEEGFNFTGTGASVYSAGATIGNNLDNSADSIRLYLPNTTLVASALYDGTMANGNGKSMELYNGTWHESIEYGGTPGRENSFKKADNTGFNETGNQTENETQSNSTNSSHCDVHFSAYTDKDIYNNSDKVKIDFELDDRSDDLDNFTIEYWIEDLFGDIAKEKYNTTNTNQKTWTADTDKEDESFYVKANLYIFCGNEQKTLYSQKMITVKGTPKPAESSIEIRELYPSEGEPIAFGKSLRARVYVYKGDESSSTVQAWIEDLDSGDKISEVQKLTLYSRFTEYDATIPIQLIANCNGDYPDGSYTLVIEGFNITATKVINAEGTVSSLCPSSDESASAQSNAAVKQTISYDITDFDEEISAGDGLSTMLSITNDGSSHDFTVWSYVYRGSKCYSGEREDNKMTVNLGPDEENIVELNNILEDAEPGAYKLKVKILKDSQKTANEITKDIIVLNSSVNPLQQGNNASKINQAVVSLVNSTSKTADAKGMQDQNNGQLITGNTVYKSSSAKAEDIAVYLIIASAIVMAIILLMKSRKRGKKKGKSQKITRNLQTLHV